MPRFFIPETLPQAGEYALPDDVVRHVQVLRMRADDEMRLFDGSGGEVRAILRDLGKRHARVELGERLAISRESPLTLCLAQGVSTGERMDFTLQKGVELGISVFQPLVTERAVLRLGGERAGRKTERWRDIVQAACEQCGRNTIPEVLPSMTLDAFLQQSLEASHRLLLSPVGNRRLADYVPPQGKVWLMAGPEGGLSDGEEQAAFARGWTPLALGPRVLRTETAALAAAAALQTVWGDLG